MPPGGLHIRWPDAPLEQEARLMDYKWYAALAYVRANRLNHNVIDGPNDRFGIIASGKAYNDTRQALRDLGLDDDTCRALGIRLHKVNVVWPLEATITRDFAQGLQEILVVEEKRQVIEYQLKEELYNWRADVRPNVLGKFDEPEGDDTGGEWSMPNPSENWLLRAKADLTPAIIAKAIAKRLKKLGVPRRHRRAHGRAPRVIEARERAARRDRRRDTGERAPWFCSGCPHNTSTRVPEGSRAMAGIGCHYMAVWMDRSTTTFTQMGGEGVPWVGQAPFTTDKHMFANLGDGTYFHCGLLAIRQSIAAGVNITYKILYNDAVAMTGGQPVGERPEGHSVLQIMKSVLAEGVTQARHRHRRAREVRGRRRSRPASRCTTATSSTASSASCARSKGTTVIIYDQTCATEKRRRRKRGTMADPDKRVVINELVCEGCGDCSVQSNCLSVEPVETEFGRKRRINQNTCNKDYSCVKGFCPSFVTVEGGQLKKPKKEAQRRPGRAAGRCPSPTLPVADSGLGHRRRRRRRHRRHHHRPAARHGRAPRRQGRRHAGRRRPGAEGRRDLEPHPDRQPRRGHPHDQGRHRRGRPGDRLRPDRRREQEHAGGDARGPHLRRAQHPRHADRGLRHATPTGSSPGGNCEAAIAPASATRLRRRASTPSRSAVQLLGDSIYTNPLMLGYAWQKGRVPLSPRGADARDRAQRRAGRQQQGRLRVGPALRARPGRGAGAVQGARR